MERVAGLGLVLSALVAPFVLPCLAILWARRHRATRGPAPVIGCRERAAMRR